MRGRKPSGSFDESETITYACPTKNSRHLIDNCEAAPVSGVTNKALIIGLENVDLRRIKPHNDDDSIKMAKRRNKKKESSQMKTLSNFRRSFRSDKSRQEKPSMTETV
eukprot:CAMPEP_0178910134 /NCGR_PEP_ID=MMETSP0786-20121207/8925_1 /TAXON_ID=186022 /ORGANISM="Thalassionema frauenfeldii, Strain CCMP 1798" /LENGTH=107 /DNA_ID=CAMNT_0020582345 /DNA_START=205 /DNA_END=528 /DNA_ORIENTATION=-